MEVKLTNEPVYSLRLVLNLLGVSGLRHPQTPEKTFNYGFVINI